MREEAEKARKESGLSSSRCNLQVSRVDGEGDSVPVNTSRLADCKHSMTENKTAKTNENGQDLSSLSIPRPMAALHHSLSGIDKNVSSDFGYDADETIEGIAFVDYRDESQLPDVMRLVGADLSEPYSIFTYRYFLHQYPDLCIFAVPIQSPTTRLEGVDAPAMYDSPIGCVVCKIDQVKDKTKGTQGTHYSLSGYMGMLAVNHKFRRCGIGKALLKRVIRRMRDRGCTSVTLETETSNTSATALYEKLGFIKEELLVRYYLNLGDAYRMKLYFS